MKIAGKIIYAVWALIIATVLGITCFSAYMGVKIHNIAESAVKSLATEYSDCEKYIEDEYNYTKLWTERPDNASYDRIKFEEENKRQEYDISMPKVLYYQDQNSYFSFNKIGYIYNNRIYSKNGTQEKGMALENSKVVLDIEYDGLDFKITKVFYDNDYNAYNIAPYMSCIELIVLLLINAIVRNVRYINYCILNKIRKRHFLRLIQPYIFPLLLLGLSFADMVPTALIIGIAEEFIFSCIFIIMNIKRKKGTSN